MAISREDLLKELLPGLNALFGLEYTGKNLQDEQTEDLKPYEIEVDLDE